MENRPDYAGQRPVYVPCPLRLLVIRLEFTQKPAAEKHGIYALFCSALKQWEGQRENEIPIRNQIFAFIVFRGSVGRH